MGVSMDKFIAQNFKVKKAKDTFNRRYDVYKTAAKRYFVYDHSASSTKLAGDMDFEQNFFQLAFTYIKDKIPTLIDYMVGFEVVDKNEDGKISYSEFRVKQKQKIKRTNSSLISHFLLLFRRFSTSTIRR